METEDTKEFGELDLLWIKKRHATALMSGHCVCAFFFARWISDNYYSLWMVRDSTKAIRHVVVTIHTPRCLI